MRIKNLSISELHMCHLREISWEKRVTKDVYHSRRFSVFIQLVYAERDNPETITKAGGRKMLSNSKYLGKREVEKLTE